MKLFIVFIAIFAVALAAPAQDVEIVKSDSVVNPDSFNFAYSTSDGTNAEAQGELKNIGAENEAIAVRGSFSFVAPDGQTYSVKYVADENGYQPEGAHLPVAPEA